MAIRGGLAEFSVPELLQLLALQQKTGVLTLVHPRGRTHVLFFWRGRVLAAADRRRTGRHDFMAHLFQNRILTGDQVDSVEDICRTTNQDIFTVLLASGTMGRDRLAEEMRRFTQRCADELVSWQDGTYEFSPCDEKSLPPHGLPIHMNPEELVLESMRRADELATMKESMLGPDVVLGRVADAPSEPLPRECMVVLRLLETPMSILELSHASPLGDYLTYEAVTELLGRQKIMIVDSAEAKEMAGRNRKSNRLSPSGVAAIVTLLIGSIFLGSGMAPLLERSRAGAGWIDPEVAARRTEVRRELQRDVTRLLEPGPR